MTDATLFGDLGEEGGKSKRAKVGAPRVVKPNRAQMLMRPSNLDSLLEPDHLARMLDAAVSRLDLSALYAGIESREDSAGRPAFDPAMLLTLWLYATKEGVGSARELERLCEEHDAYRWICGGLTVNHHTLSDFRVQHTAVLDGLLTNLLAVLMHKGVLTLRRVSQDGMKVRASAGTSSFRRERRLKECRRQAREQVEALKLQREDPAQGPSRNARRRAAAERAARERLERVELALAELEEVRQSESKRESEEAREQARVSTTDPQARVMKMGDGGFRPAYNVQLAADTQSRLIVGVEVSKIGSDFGSLEPMVEQVERRTERSAKEWLVDGGFAKKQSIETLARSGVKVFAPVQGTRGGRRDRFQTMPKEGVELAAWRRRMGSVRGQKIYRERAAVSETVNADLRVLRGFDRMLVRGPEKVLAVALLAALTYDLLRCIAQGWLTS
jgi:transposase